MEPIVEVNLVGLIMDQVSKSPVMLLKARDEKKVIPIWIGMSEANAIAMELENVCSPRPMTHDLLRNIMRDLEAILAKVIISDIVENTYYAEMHIERKGEERVIDCRPSDAVALALKNHAKIYVSRQVLETSVLADVFCNCISGEQRIDRWFESLSDDDFGGIEQ